MIFTAYNEFNNDCTMAVKDATIIFGFSVFTYDFADGSYQ